MDYERIDGPNGLEIRVPTDEGQTAARSRTRAAYFSKAPLSDAIG